MAARNLRVIAANFFQSKYCLECGILLVPSASTEVSDEDILGELEETQWFELLPKLVIVQLRVH